MFAVSTLCQQFTEIKKILSLPIYWQPYKVTKGTVFGPSDIPSALVNSNSKAEKITSNDR